jgi:penicillin-binding protein 1A
MTAALKDKPATPFRVPAGIKLIRVDPKTGMRAGGEGGILEAFKPGTAPPDSYSVIGASAGDGSTPFGVAPGARPIGSGTGGLY